MNASVNFFFRPAKQLRNESHIFFGGPVRKQCRLLQYISDPAPQLDFRYFPGVDSIDRDLACGGGDRKSTRLNSSHVAISYAVFCFKKKTSRIKLFCILL